MTRSNFPGNCPIQDHPCLLLAVPPFDGEAQLTVSGQSNDDDNDFEEYGLSDSDDSKVELCAPLFCPFSSQKRARGGETRARFGDGSGEDKEEGTDETATLMKKDMEAGGGGDSDDSKVELFAPRFCLLSSQKRDRGSETRARFGDGGGED